jgi:hypothetical protein
VAALRQVVPLEPRQRSLDPGTPTEKAIHFIQTTPAADFITDDPSHGGLTLSSIKRQRGPPVTADSCRRLPEFDRIARTF